jgi:hypothetical protein
MQYLWHTTHLKEKIRRTTEQYRFLYNLDKSEMTIQESAPQLFMKISPSVVTYSAITAQVQQTTSILDVS